MDPDEALKNARAALLSLRAGESDSEAPCNSPSCDDLADAFEALDGWLSKGGFLPCDWAEQSAKPSGAATPVVSEHWGVWCTPLDPVYKPCWLTDINEPNLLREANEILAGEMNKLAASLRPPKQWRYEARPVLVDGSPGEVPKEEPYKLKDNRLLQEQGSLTRRGR